jgi:hypothetical protein
VVQYVDDKPGVGNRDGVAASEPVGAPVKPRNRVPLLLRDAGTDLATLQALKVALGFAVGVLSRGIRVRGSASLGVLIHLAALERFLLLPLRTLPGCRCHNQQVAPPSDRQTARRRRRRLRGAGALSAVVWHGENRRRDHCYARGAVEFV